MTDFSFDIAHWLMWSHLLEWFLTIVGFTSALVAFGNYKFSNHKNTIAFSILLLIGMLILLGLYPIEWGFGTDRQNYGINFLGYKNISFDEIETEGEFGYAYIQFALSRFLNVTQFMFAITLIYLANYFFAIWRMVRENHTGC